MERGGGGGGGGGGEGEGEGEVALVHHVDGVNQLHTRDTSPSSCREVTIIQLTLEHTTRGGFPYGNLVDVPRSI